MFFPSQQGSTGGSTPSSAAKVGIQSTMCRGSATFRGAQTLGHITAAGVRMPPSYTVALVPRRG